jgi:hypothetical protein
LFGRPLILEREGDDVELSNKSHLLWLIPTAILLPILTFWTLAKTNVYPLAIIVDLLVFVIPGAGAALIVHTAIRYLRKSSTRWLSWTTGISLAAYQANFAGCKFATRALWASAFSVTRLDSVSKILYSNVALKNASNVLPL